MKKHQALLTELAGHEPRISVVADQGEQMVKEQHFASDDIQQKVNELQDKWQQLKVRAKRSKICRVILLSNVVQRLV